MKTIDTDDLRVLCDSCRAPLKFALSDGLHGPELAVERCECRADSDAEFHWDDGHETGYREGLKERKRDRAEAKKRHPLDLPAVSKADL